jgi:tetratricopeptide (TPR) repeat protein
VEGFSQFLVVREAPEIYAESQYGRGLAFLDLGSFGQAREDLEAAAKDPRTATKAKAALAELERRQTGKKTPAPEDPEALLARLGDLAQKASDTAAAKDATALARGLAARGGDWPKRVDAAVATRLGDGTPAGVRSSFGLLLLGQLAIDRGRCADVGPLAAAGAALHDATRARDRPELLFLDAGCRLNTGRSRDAAQVFGELLRDFPDAPRAREAAYYRFRALDVARATDPSLVGEYEEALAAYVKRFDRAEGVVEASFLLGELHRSRGDCAAAAADYARAATGPFAVRARLGTLECDVGALAKAGKDAPPEARAAVVQKLRAFVHDTPAKGDAEQPVARAALMGGLVASDARPPDTAAVIEFLGGYEQRFPDEKPWHALAIARRLVARAGRGELDDAARDLDAYLVADDPDRRRTLSDVGRALQHGLDVGDEPQRAKTLAFARKAYGALVQAGGDQADRVALADLDLRAGDAGEARRLYDDVLAKDPSSAEALRGAARAAAAAGDRAAALGRWKQVVETSPTGGTAWYEARIAEVRLLLDAGDAGEACEVIRLSRGRATTTGGSELDKQLAALGAGSCR